jgi:hypothetical protein
LTGSIISSRTINASHSNKFSLLHRHSRKIRVGSQTSLGRSLVEAFFLSFSSDHSATRAQILNTFACLNDVTEAMKVTSQWFAIVIGIRVEISAGQVFSTRLVEGPCSRPALIGQTSIAQQLHFHLEMY